eukprot:GHRR01017095.1.p1 GENE.GHRR01017095.1~~GHRR01017095.1.p1  ORF type:complete len:246 (-),score=73.56 GHRR01017095.1:484-1221(-)
MPRENAQGPSSRYMMPAVAKKPGLRSAAAVVLLTAPVIVLLAVVLAAATERSDAAKASSAAAVAAAAADADPAAVAGAAAGVTIQGLGYRLPAAGNAFVDAARAAILCESNRADGAFNSAAMPDRFPDSDTEGVSDAAPELRMLLRDAIVVCAAVGLAEAAAEAPVSCIRVFTTSTGFKAVFAQPTDTPLAANSRHNFAPVPRSASLSRTRRVIRRRSTLLCMKTVSKLYADLTATKTTQQVTFQ